MQRGTRFWWTTYFLSHLLMWNVWRWLQNHIRQEWYQYLKKTLILKVHRNNTDGLWDIPISIPLRHHAHSIITRYITKTEFIQYLLGYCFSPTSRTFLKSINNWNFLTWPGLIKKNKNMPPSITTSLGHLDQEINDLQSAKQVKPEF